MEQEECNVVETVRGFTYLGDWVSAGEGCEAAVTARTRHEWVKFREFVDLLYGRRFPLRLKGAVCESYVKPAMLYASEAWCLKESEIKKFTNYRKIHGDSNVWSTAQKQKTIYRFDVHAGFE